MIRYLGSTSIFLLAFAAYDVVAAPQTREEAVNAPAPEVANSSNEATAFFDHRPLSLPSPDGRYRLVSESDESGLTRLIVLSDRNGSASRQTIGAFEPPGSVLWSPGSDAFLLNDQRGSGQTSYLEIVRLRQGRFQRDVDARRNLSRLYNRLFECALPEEAIVTTGDGWLDRDRISVTVQATLHSGGCPLDPFAANRLMLVVDARTGQILSRRLQ